MFAQEKEEKDFINYTKYLKDKKEKEIDQIHRIKSKNQKKQKNAFQLGESREKSNQAGPKKNQLKHQRVQKESKESENWVKIDDKASIVNGKLVYMEDEKPSLAETDQLIVLLRQNQIRIKEYIYGDKTSILQAIEKNYQENKNEEVEKYINKNMKEENTIKTNHSSWYEQAREHLFNSP